MRPCSILLATVSALAPCAAFAQAGSNNFSALTPNASMPQLQAEMQTNAQASDEFSGNNITLQPGYVTPVCGCAITAPDGNVYSLQMMPNLPMGIIMMNGSPAPGASQYIDAITLVGNRVYAEDGKGHGWFTYQNGNWSGPGGAPGQTDGTISGSAADTATAASDPASTNNSGQSCPGMTALVGILPGVGSFTDSAGNTYSIDPNENTALINGAPITPNGESSNTSQMTLVGGVVYGEDATTNQWFEMVPGPGGDRPWAWQPVAALPQTGQSPTVTTRWDTAQTAAPTNLCQALHEGQGAATPVTSLPAAQPTPASVTPVTSLGPAMSLAGGMTTTPGTVTPANSIGGAQ